MAEVARLREAFSNGTEGSGSPSEAAPLFGATAWSGEALNEAEWTRMRLEEERKEQAEEEERRLRVEEEAQRQAEARRKREEAAAAEGEFAFPSGGKAGAMTGLSARRRKRTPSLQLPGNGVNRSSSSSDESADAAATAKIPPIPRRASDFAISGSNPRPLPSAGLLGSFPGRPPVNGIEDAPDAAHQLTKTLPSLALRNTHASIVEEDELSPRSALPPDTPGSKGPGKSGLSSSSTQASHSSASSGPASPASKFRAYNGDAFRAGEAATAPTSACESPEMPRFPGAFPQSALKSPQSAASKVSTKSGSRPGSFHAALPSASSTSSLASASGEPGMWSSTSSTSMKPSRSSGPTSTISRSSSSSKNHVFPKNNFGAGSNAADEERKQRHRRTFSSELNWEQVVKIGAAPGLVRAPSAGAGSFSLPAGNPHAASACNGAEDHGSSAAAP